MTEQLPAPPLPADVDLTDFGFMPLEVRRLRDSRFPATVTGDEFMAGVLLWCAAWHQLPCGSLPDDDVELANLSGFGRVLREWRKVRNGALYGFVRCSDGRLYHSVIVEKALEAWDSKLHAAYDRMVDRTRKANKHRAQHRLTELAIPTFEAWKAGGRIDPAAQLSAGIPTEIPEPSAGIPPELRRSRPPPSAGIPAENALKGQGEGQGEVRDTYTAHARTGTGIPPESHGATERNREAPRGTHSDSWQLIRDAYPDFTGRRDWITAQHYACALVDSAEATWLELLEGVQRYAAYVVAGGVSGPRYVMTPAKFFHEADRPWSQAWDPPGASTPKSLNLRTADEIEAEELARAQH